MKSVFISHSWHDKRLARRIAGAIQGLGGRVWLDEAEIKLGDSLVEKIREGIDSVDYVVALLSDRSVASEWVSKELDIAMNQEIAGRRVKVLPILATRCNLPGFLQGKLYADMSSEKEFKIALPMLLDRLSAPKDLLERARAGVPLVELVEEGEWVRSLTESLASEDEGVQYTGLKSSPTSDGASLISHPDVLDKLSDAALSSRSVHVRVRALQILASVEDENFSYRIEPLLDDETPQVVCAAVAALARMKAQNSAPRLIDLLRSHSDPAVQRACLKGFSELKLDDKALVRSLTSVCESLSEIAQRDRGLEFLIIEALVNQAKGHADEVAPFLIRTLDSGRSEATAAALEGLAGVAGYFYLSSPKLRFDFGQAVLRACDSSDPSIAAPALIAMVVLGDSLPSLSRERLWDKVKTAEKWTIAGFLESLQEYRLEVIFDQPEDDAQLIYLLGVFDEEIDQMLIDLIVGLGTSHCLAYLSTIGYEPDGWRKVDILRAAFELREWTEDMLALLDRARRDLPAYTMPEGPVFGDLALYSAGKLGLNEVLERFPKPSEFPSYRNHHPVIAERLDGLKAKGTPAQKRKISRIVRALRSIK